MEGNRDLESIMESLFEYASEITNKPVTELLDDFKSDIVKYKNMISSFFVGKEDEIKSIYNALKDNQFPHNTVSVIDVNYAIKGYQDYFNGMCEFAEKLSSLTDNDTVDATAVNNTIEKICDKDAEFRSSLFGGDKNPVKSVSIDTAMCNVEELIDIDKSLSEILNRMTVLVNNVTNNQSEKYNFEIIKGFNILFNSLRSSIYKSITSIMDTYVAIVESMKERTGVKGAPETPKYQVF